MPRVILQVESRPPCVCGKPSTKSGWCRGCDRLFGDAAWEAVRPGRARKKAPPTGAAAVPDIALEIETADIDPMEAPEPKQSPAATLEPAATPATEEEASMSSKDDNPAPQPRRNLSLFDMDASQRETVLQKIRSLRALPGFDELVPGDLRDEVARLTDRGDGRGGLHVHLSAFKVLLREVSKNGAGAVTADADEQAPATTEPPVEDVADRVVVGLEDAPTTWTLVNEESSEPQRAGASTEGEPESWMLMETTPRGARVRLDVEVPLGAAGLLVMGVCQTLEPHGIRLSAAEVARG